MSDYRPADYQITIHYQCTSCGAKTKQNTCYVAGNCSCGGKFMECGRSYPPNPDDWDEQCDPDGEWRERRY